MKIEEETPTPSIASAIETLQLAISDGLDPDIEVRIIADRVEIVANGTTYLPDEDLTAEKIISSLVLLSGAVIEDL